MIGVSTVILLFVGLVCSQFNNLTKNPVIYVELDLAIDPTNMYEYVGAADHVFIGSITKYVVIIMMNQTLFHIVNMMLKLLKI